METTNTFTQIRSDFFEYFKSLNAEQLAGMSAANDIANPEGHRISDKNIAFLQFQNTKDMKFTVIAGYKQWSKYGRQVKKGSHGFWIFIPSMTRTKVDGKTVEEFDRFLMAKVFDISQTFEIKEPAIEAPVLETADAVF
jgi:hypothetical protein